MLGSLLGSDALSLMKTSKQKHGSVLKRYVNPSMTKWNLFLFPRQPFSGFHIPIFFFFLHMPLALMFINLTMGRRVLKIHLGGWDFQQSDPELAMENGAGTIKHLAPFTLCFRFTHLLDETREEEARVWLGV